jgi:HlyD family secretion protein
MRKILIVGLLIALLVVGGWFVYQRIWLPRQAADEAPAYTTTVVERGSIASTVSATGSLEPQLETSLTFRAPGLVDAVYVETGQRVRAGELLSELDATDLTLALAQAQAAVEVSEAQVTKLETPPNENDMLAAQAAVEVAQTGVAGAEAALEAAQAAYRQLFVPISDDQAQVNLAQVRQAEANVQTAQRAYDQIRNLPNAGALPQSAELQQATIALEVARAQAALTDQPVNQAEVTSALNQIAQAEVSLRQAQSNLIQARNNLDTLLEGPDVQDVRVARAQLQQARLSELQAENNLGNTQLTAPLDGVVTSVNVKPNEQINAGLPAVVVTDLDNLEMTVLVDEIDVRQLALGQPTRIRVDALPEDELTGRVTEIAPTAEDVGGVIAYAVTIVPEIGAVPVRAGMSGTAFITTADVDDAVLLPNRFIQLDRETDQAFVYKLVDGEPVLQEVELGLRNERVSQILAGLDDGDEVALVTRSSEDALRGAIFGGD